MLFIDAIGKRRKFYRSFVSNFAFAHFFFYIFFSILSSRLPRFIAIQSARITKPIAKGISSTTALFPSIVSFIQTREDEPLYGNPWAKKKETSYTTALACKRTRHTGEREREEKRLNQLISFSFFLRHSFATPVRARVVSSLGFAQSLDFF